jgi:hypothetical protein
MYYLDNKNNNGKIPCETEVNKKAVLKKTGYVRIKLQVDP